MLSWNLVTKSAYFGPEIGGECRQDEANGLKSGWNVARFQKMELPGDSESTAKQPSSCHPMQSSSLIYS